MIPGFFAVGARRTGAGDPYWAYVSSLLHFDGPNGSTTFTDQKGKLWSRTDGAAITSEGPKFGSGSLKVYDGSLTSKIETPAHSDFDFGVGDFTIEWWQYWIGANWPRYQAAFAHGYNAPGALVVVTGNTDARYAVTMGANVSVAKEATPGVLGVWTHYAVVRSGTSVFLWRGGVLSASGTYAPSLGINRNFALGGYGSDSGAPGQAFNGRIDDFRVTKGVARYLAPFSPPTAPFPDGA